MTRGSKYKFNHYPCVESVDDKLDGNYAQQVTGQLKLAVIMVVTHSQETCTRNSTVWHGFLHRIQHSSIPPYKKLACTWLEMVSSDWSAAYHCHCFHFVVFMLLTICCTKLI